jgi:hypothetical protein
VFIATTSAVLLAACAGCIGPTSPVEPVSHLGSSDLGLYNDPDVVLGTLVGELRRGAPLAADDEGLDPTMPWQNVSVEILDASGQKAKEAMSDAQGMFRVDLEPGSYRVVPLWPLTQLYSFPFIVDPPSAYVTVVAGEIASVRLFYNPGTF